ncbi:hypothetical protein H5410_042570 [Solanum commersonii]|uniref:Uncharacterized protein n=1 Tax=Solanum commersonii TaxID=4109 RepID=A0A9J5XXV4_SOLCO|nr:hypothetical protein H5410_042570 [Solanum commersonii]
MIDTIKRNTNVVDTPSNVNMAEQPDIVPDPSYPILDTKIVPSDTEVEVISSIVSPQLSDVVRKSNRPVKPPLWHTYYVLTKKNKSVSACLYSIVDAVDYQSITPTYKTCSFYGNENSLSVS